MTLERPHTPNAWDLIATGYDAHVTPSHHEVAAAALDHAGVQAGDRVLDVAAGSGAVSLPAAARGARVLAIDISRTMLDRLDARAQADHLSVETRVMDGHHLELEDGTFDLAISQFGLMLFPDLRQGLREMVRVTRSGGRVVVNVYGAPQQVEFLTTFIGAIRQVVPGFVGLPLDPLPLPFQVSDPQRLQDELQAAGLDDVRVETVTEHLHFASGQQMWDWVVNSNPVAVEMIAGLDERQRKEVRAVLDGIVRERTGASGVATLSNPVHIGIGTK